MADTQSSSRNFPLAVETGLGADFFLLSGVRGREALSELFHYELDLLAAPDAAVPFEKILGKPATVRLQGPGNTSRTIHGIISRFRQADADEDYAYFHAEFVPHFWLWTKSAQSRVFQEASVVDILKQVLQGLPVSWDLSREYPRLNYRVQYRESNFAFASRLMESAGIYYYFKHEPGQDVLVVSDRTQAYPDLAAPSTLEFNRVAGSTTNHAYVTKWNKAQTVGVGTYHVGDYHFEVSQHRLEASATLADEAMAGTVRHALREVGESCEVFDFPGGFASAYDGIDANGERATENLQPLFTEPAHAAELWMQREACAVLEVRGEGSYTNLQPGYQVQLQRHAHADGAYLLTGVTIDARMTGYRSGAEAALEYKNSFECLPAALPYRPPARTPKPVITGPQTAVVTGVDSNVPHVDPFGRVKVQFRWDRNGKNTALSSCWIRVGQVWAGAGWGATFWPRPGHEVIVAFEDGDPDRPLIVGSVYNDRNMPPYSLPQDAHLAGIKSCSASSDASAHKQFSYVTFNDQLGGELLLLHSEGHVQVDSENSRWQIDPQCRFRRTGGTSPAGWRGGGASTGSGSGGGSFDWVQSAWGAFSVDFTLGLSVEMAIGGIGFFALGAQVEVTLNPLGQLLDLGAVMLTTPALAAASILGGDVGINFCSQIDVLYGPFLEVHRGIEQQITGHFDATAMFLSGLVEVVTAAAMVNAAFIDPSEKSSWEEDLEALGPATGVPTLATAVVVGVESVNAAAETAELLLSELTTLSYHIDAYTLTIAAAAAVAIESTGVAEAATVTDLLSGVGRATTISDTSAIPPTLNNLSDFPTLVGAQAYTIIASADATAVGASFIHINAYGAGDNGDLFVTASRSIDMRLADESTGQLAITAGTSKMVMNPITGIMLGCAFDPFGPTSGVVIESGLTTVQALETVTLQAGDYPVFPSTLTMTTEKVTLDALSIVLEGDSIVLQTSTGYPKLTLNPTSITLELAGGQILSLSADGFAVVVGENSIGLNAVMMALKAGGQTVTLDATGPQLV